jgi:hypothetical protein
MLNKLVSNTSKSAWNILSKQSIRSFASAAKAAPAQGENMAMRFHDIYIQELDKLQKTK